MRELVLAILATEALVSLIKNASILTPIKFRFKEFTGWLVDSEGKHLIDCGYCLSVWCALVVWGILQFPKLNWILMVLVIHRGANVAHHLIDVLWDFKINLRLWRG